MKGWLLIFLVITCNFAMAQTTLPSLSKKEMYADFDTLIIALTKINPHDYVRRMVNNYAMKDSIIQLRKQIEHIDKTEDFFWLVNKALTYCQDGHTSIVRHGFYGFVDSLDRIKWHTTEADTSVIKIYRALLRAKVKSYKLKLPIKYIDGEYRALCDFTYQKTTVPFGAILSRCNHQSIHQYIQPLVGSIAELHWDFQYKRFYTENFTQSFHLSPTDLIDLEFSTKKTAISIKCRLDDTVSTLKPLKYLDPGQPMVAYFEDYQTLYLHMPSMKDGDYYVRKIDTVTAGKTIKKVIFDIRDNPGGSDPEWQMILRHLVHQPIIRHITYAANKDNPRRDRLSLAPPSPINVGQPRILRANFIKEDLYQYISKDIDTFEVDDHSLHFKGKIYVLQNENCFSSAGSLISTCQFSDQLINIGNSTGWFAGFGSMPWVMILPHSKILYWTEPLLDFTNVKKPEDLFHNDVKINIQLTLEDYAKRYTSNTDWYAIDYLLHQDKAMQFILNLILRN